MTAVISDTSPITSLAAISRLSLLQQLYGSMIIPEAVYRQLRGVGIPVPGTVEVQTLDWIRMGRVANRTLVTEPGVPNRQVTFATQKMASEQWVASTAGML
ncbi:MAG: hypothetical protein MUC60_08370 [Oscillatoria sp. Prado101]|nr:hypothetical protein [Oscillatoria sp. Prado101]